MDINYRIDIHYKNSVDSIPIRTKRMFNDVIRMLDTPKQRVFITDACGEIHILNTFEMQYFHAYRVEEDEE